jgi:hypothetical protein
LWASEPGETYNGAGIGENVNGHPYYGIVNANRGAAYIRFREQAIIFENMTSAGARSESARFVPNGNLGIGTSSPNAKLTIKKDGGGTEPSVGGELQLIASTSSINPPTQWLIGDSLLGDIRFGRADSITSFPNSYSMIRGLYGSGDARRTLLTFFTSDTGDSTERMRIDSSGNVLVGGASAIAVGIPTLQLGGCDGNGLITVRRNTTEAAGAINFYNPNGNIGNIILDGSSTTYATSSDYSLKEDWQPMEGNIDRLMQLKPCNFAWKVDGSRVDGFLAHEAQEVVPEAVTGTKDAMRTEQYEVSPAVYEDIVIPAEFDEEGNEISPERTEQKLVSEAVMGEREVPEYQGIDQAKLVPLLTAALQDAVKEIEALKARIEALEG